MKAHLSEAASRNFARQARPGEKVSDSAGIHHTQGFVLAFGEREARGVAHVARREGMEIPEFVGRAIELADWLNMEMDEGNLVVIVDRHGRVRREVKPFGPQ